MISFGIFNIFAFTISYFRLVSASNTIQQAIMSNNYLTDADMETFSNYLGNLETTYLRDIKVVLNTNVDNPSNPVYEPDKELVLNNNDSACIRENKRRQYGTLVDCGVVANYTFILPLQYAGSKDSIIGGDVNGFGKHAEQIYDQSGGVNAGHEQRYLYGADYDKNSDETKARFRNKISVVNRVVGMQYYSDLD